MNNLGLGVMINMLGGNEQTVNTLQSSIGKKIKNLKLGEDDALHFVFEDDSKIKVLDDGQACCESRYMRTDDELSYFIGAELTSMEIREGPEEEDDYGAHEVQFLVVGTSKGSFTMASHNEHNGYYGGFWIVIRPE